MRPQPSRFPIVRLPSRRTILALVLALTAGLLVLRTSTRAAAVVDRWGAVRTVWIATTDVAPGEEIGPGDVVPDERPVAVVPDASVSDHPVGRVATGWALAGEVLVEARLAAPGRSGPSALVPEGWRALAVPQLDAVLAVEPGQRVDVLVAFDPGTTSGPPGAVVVDDALVVGVDDDGTATVAVPAADAPRVAAALVSGVVSLALRG